MTRAGKRSVVRALALFIGMTAWLVAGREPVVIERRISLLAQLDRVQRLPGGSGSEAFGQPLVMRQTSHVNREAGGMSIYAPRTGSLLWPAVAIHPRAVLKLHVSLDPENVPKLPSAEPFTETATVFRVEVREQEASQLASHRVFETELRSTALDGIVSPALAIPLQQYAGRTVDLIFTTEERSAGRGKHGEPADLLPCWRDPVIESAGKRVDLDRLPVTDHRLVADLASEFRSAQLGSGAGDRLRVERRCLREPKDHARAGVWEAIERPMVSADTEFDLELAGGSARDRVPAIVFAGTSTASYRLPALPHGAQLCFSIALKDLPQRNGSVPHTGAASFRVTLDGEVVFDQRLAAAGASSWRAQ